MQADRPVEIRSFFDEDTNSVTHLVGDPTTRTAAVIDPVLDFDAASGALSTASADAILGALREEDWKLAWILETHAHADHLSAAQVLKRATGAPVAIGAQIRAVQRIFAPIFDARDVSGEGVEFDRLFEDGDTFPIGSLEAHVLHTPGHTPACVTYRIGDALFVGDTLFMPDYGTARADFPGGSAETLHRSIRRILALPAETRIFLCHDYGAPGRSEFIWETSVGEEREKNVHVGGDVSEAEFVKLRTERDATLRTPRLLLPSIQVNIRAGHLPPAEANGTRYLRVPLSGAV